MSVGGIGIDAGRIQAMVEQLRAAAEKAQGPNGAAKAAVGGINGPKAESPAATVDFSSALKNSLDQVNNAQLKAEQLGKQFAMGDDSVNLSDVMIASQKANISFQATIQVRNKLVSAYHDIMTMQV
jgi:flagellar hook-basal body complex protein FliE